MTDFFIFGWSIPLSKWWIFKLVVCLFQFLCVLSS